LALLLIVFYFSHLIPIHCTVQGFSYTVYYPDDAETESGVGAERVRAGAGASADTAVEGGSDTPRSAAEALAKLLTDQGLPLYELYASTARVIKLLGKDPELAATMYATAANRANKLGMGQLALQYSTAADA
jgi:hypothetical protein